MPAILVIFYSLTGTSRTVARALAAQQGWPLGEVIETTPRAGWRGWLRCVLDSLAGRHPAVRYQGPDPSGFDRIVLVAPIWAGRLAAPMRSFAAAEGHHFRHYALVTTSGSGDSKRAQAELARTLGRRPIGCAAFHARHVTDGSYDNVLQEFGAAIAGSFPTTSCLTTTAQGDSALAEGTG